MMPSVKPTIVRRLIPLALAALCMLSRASAQQVPQALPPAYEPPRAAEMRRDPEVAPAAYTSAPASSQPQVPAVEPPAPIGLKPAEAKSAKKLSLPGSNRDGDKSADKPNAAGGLSGVFSVLGSLGVVLGLFLMMAWLMRRGLPKQGRMLPREAVESLGRIPFPGRQQGQLLRVGNKLILVSFSNSGADVIAEITDPLEVDRLSGLCAQADRYSSVKTFRDVVDQFFGEKPGRRDAARQAAAAKIKERDVA